MQAFEQPFVQYFMQPVVQLFMHKAFPCTSPSIAVLADAINTCNSRRAEGRMIKPCSIEPVVFQSEFWQRARYRL